MRYSERILYVDDDPLACRAFARSMREEGFIVDTAKSGEEALQAVRTYPYAVLAADWQMPGLDGLQLVERVRKSNQDPVCVLVTGAWNTVRDEALFGQLGVVDVIRKPWNPQALASTLRHSLNEFYGREGSAPSSKGNTSLLWLDAEGTLSNGLDDQLREECGYVVVRAHSEQEAIDQLEHGRFAAVLTEVGTEEMPCSERIRRVCIAARSAPVIALGRQRSTEASVAAVRAGAQDYHDVSTLDVACLHRSIQHAIERQKAGERLAHIAHHDVLTDLPNRALLEERLNQAVSRAKRRGRLTAVFYLDLDRFKPINDMLGHAAGDELLRQVAGRLKGSVRETDTVARLGGDEFAVVLEELESSEEATLLAQRILNSFATTFKLESYEVTTSTSIGIALHPHNGEEAPVLLKRADAAMYRAKTDGRNSYRFYSEELHHRAVQQTELQRALKDAINNEEFELAFQPQVCTHAREVIGMEVLLRWQRPEFGTVMPSEFASSLDDTGLVMQLGEWVVRKACQQIAAWNQSSHYHLKACVNVSSRQFESPTFADGVRRALDDYGLAAKDLELELQECVLLKDTPGVRSSFEELKAMGVRMAFDDFGTGYSSLTCLRRYSLDTIKIGRSFVTALETKVATSEFAAALLSVGKNLGLNVVAVGVERRGQLDFLERQGCDGVQGFLIARPMSAAQTTGWLQRVQALRERAPLAARKAVLPLGMGKLVAWPQLELARAESPLVSKH